MSTGQIRFVSFVFETTALQFLLLSPRSRLSVRCLVFKELFVAAVAATRSKFYKTSFRLVKSFLKIFFVFFSLFIEKRSLSIKKLPAGSLLDFGCGGRI